MPNEPSGSHQVRQRPEAALTPRPLRLLLVGRVRPGAEPALREVQARFPLDAAAEAGIDAVEPLAAGSTRCNSRLAATTCSGC